MSLVPAQRAAKRARTLATLSEVSEMPKFQGETVPVTVGEGTYHYHKSVLTKSSELLKTEVEARRGVEVPGSIDLSMVAPNVFQSYVRWLYTRMIDARECGDNTYYYLAYLYVLGEKLIDETFKMAVINAIIDHAIDDDTYPSFLAVKAIYGGTEAGSPARRLMVDFWASIAKADWGTVTNLSKAVCVDFVDDLVPVLLERRTGPKARPWVTSPESYHTMLDKKLISNNETKTPGAMVQHSVPRPSPQKGFVFTLVPGTN